METKLKIQKARTSLILDYPFFGSLAFKMELLDDATCKTMWTDGKKIGYNPDYINTLSTAELIGIFAHEVMHVAMLHHTRRKGRKFKKWNYACDYAINDVLLQSGFTLPRHALRGFGIEECAESIYEKIPDPPEDEEDNNIGEVRDATNDNGSKPSNEEIKEIEAETKVNVTESLTSAKTRGTVPAKINRMIDDMLEAVVPWKDVLMRFVDIHVRNDYSWSRPNRKYISHGMYLPVLYNEEIGKIGIAVDTSLSINKNNLEQFAGEMSYIIEYMKAHVIVIYCDAANANIEEFDYNDMPIEFNPKGGGGTDFRPPFMEIERRNEEISCMIYMTDGFCNKFPHEPDYPVLWAVLNHNKKFKPPFGEVIIIE